MIYTSPLDILFYLYERGPLLSFAEWYLLISNSLSFSSLPFFLSVFYTHLWYWYTFVLMAQVSQNHYFQITRMSIQSMNRHLLDNYIKWRFALFNTYTVHSNLDVGQKCWLAIINADGGATNWNPADIWFIRDNWSLKRSSYSFSPANICHCCNRICALEWRSNFKVQSLFISGNYLFIPSEMHYLWN